MPLASFGTATITLLAVVPRVVNNGVPVIEATVVPKNTTVLLEKVTDVDFTVIVAVPAVPSA